MTTHRDSTAGLAAGDTDERSLQSNSRDLLHSTTGQDGSSTSAPPFDAAASSELEELDTAREALSAARRELLRAASRNLAVRHVFEEAVAALRRIDAIRRALRVKAGV